MKRLAGALAALLLVMACVYTYKLEAPETRSYPASGIARLSASSKNGKVTVADVSDTLISATITRQAYGRNKADAEKAIANVVISDPVVGNEQQLKADMPGGNRNYGASFEISCPAATGLALATSNSEVTVTGMTGGISATTSNGRIGLTDTRGAASLVTSNAAVDVAVHRGGVNAHTSNAAVSCDLAELGATEAVTLATSNGAVTLLLPADVSATVDVTTSSGLITINDFTVSYDVQESDHVRGRIGSGASAITISTSNGNVTVRRRS